MNMKKKKNIEKVSGFNAVYDGNAKVLIMGTIPSAGGVEYGFYYMSKVNHFWEYLTKTLGTTDFVALANDYRQHYKSDNSEFYKQKVKQALYNNNIALFDVISNCERTGSADNEITASQNNSEESIVKILKDNPNIKMIFVNSFEVEKRLKKIFGGNFAKLQKILDVDYIPVCRILSPSPICRMSHSEEEILQSWKLIKDFALGDENCINP